MQHVEASATWQFIRLQDLAPYSLQIDCKLMNPMLRWVEQPAITGGSSIVDGAFKHAVSIAVVGQGSECAANLQTCLVCNCYRGLLGTRLQCLLGILANELEVLRETPPCAILLLAQLFPHHIKTHRLLNLIIVTLDCLPINGIFKHVCRVLLGYLIEEAAEKV